MLSAYIQSWDNVNDFLRVLQSSMKTNQVKYLLYKIRGDQAATHFPSNFSCFYNFYNFSVVWKRAREGAA